MTWLEQGTVISAAAILLSACVAPGSIVREDPDLAVSPRKTEPLRKGESSQVRSGSRALTGPATPEQPEHARRNVLLGDWYVTSVTGEPAARGEPAIEVAIGEKTIQAKAHCLRFHWEYSRSGERITVRPQQNIFVATCHRGMSAWESKFSKAMLSAAELSIRQDEFTTILGKDGIVTLRRKWYFKTDVGYSFGSWRVEAISGSPLAANEVIRLSFDNDQIAAQSQCLRWLWSYSRGSSNAVATKKENPGEMCARGLSRNEEVFEKIVGGARTIDQRADGTMLIRSDEGEIFARRT